MIPKIKRTAPINRSGATQSRSFETEVSNKRLFRAADDHESFPFLEIHQCR